MKTQLNFLAIILIAGIAAACSNVEGEATKTTGANEMKSMDYNVVMAVDKDQSVLGWEGYKPTGQHHGIVEFKSGDVKLQDGKLVGGTFVFDMNKIIVQDLTDPEWNGKLTGHLKSADFFEVEAYPEATFEITNVEPVDGSAVDMSNVKGDIVPTHAITGNLTMKGITKGITFHAKVDMKDNMLMARSNMFFLDRTEWNVQFKSKKIFAELKDDFINDEMGIRFEIVATANSEDLTSR